MIRRAFLIGGVAAIGGGIFAVQYGDKAARSQAAKLTDGKGGHNFGTWLRIGEDDTVTLYSPHTDIGQGSNTGLAQMLAEELDPDWSKLAVVSAPAEAAFANVVLGKGFMADMSGYPGIIGALPMSLLGMLARQLNLQITGGSSALRFTGQNGLRVLGAGTRAALIETAAARMGVPAGELTTANGKVLHAKSGKALRYGELAAEAATHSLSGDVALKDPKDFKHMGKSIPRFDIPAKVNGTAQYGMDVMKPGMRVATVIAASVRGGKLESVDPAPAMAVAGVEKVISLEGAVVVVAKGYWQALKGARALAPKFSDGGNGLISTATIFAEQDKLRGGDKPDKTVGEGDVDAALKAGGVKVLQAEFRMPFLHHAMMEPFALTAHYKDGHLDVWGGMQDPLGAKAAAASAAGLGADKVTFHPMLIGGSFGRRLPMYMEVVDQVARVAMQVPFPVKLIWSREEEVSQGAYRPQSSAWLTAALGQDGKIAAWRTDFAQPEDGLREVPFFYDVPAVARRHFKQVSNQTVGAWRSVNATQHGFTTESFMDELAHAAGVDPVEFRLRHLKAGSRHRKVLEEVAKRSGWGSPVEAGRARGVAMVECFNTIVAQVIEASLGEDGMPKVHKATAVVDCGTVVNPTAAEGQILGGLVMGLSSGIGEAITLDKGVVQQSNFSDYEVLKLANAPSVDVHFLNSGAEMGGIGEPGLPPATPALANALFALTGKRVRNLPIKDQAKA
ncbi:molybdopterin cofactor-binding domain-containing protein [Novosphingobium sp. PASSN1]|uniref:xanthine dehydrogenase family protein molybdopterin-binding subunit n=1 Tax=Novosphingobium sp. PASSN1 TaxID=2015561 RepID=UPI0025E86F22|nr:molybdopterin cofactor-binding domain-containing protein [Novosphingobium sp. PASSN1]